MGTFTDAAEQAVAIAKDLTPEDIVHTIPAAARVKELRPIAAVHPAHMIQALIARPDVDLDKVEKMFELQERYEQNEAKKAYYAAVAAAQAEMPDINQNKTVDYTTAKGRTHFDFASLSHILKQVRPVLAKHKLTLTWRTGVNDQGNPVVTAYLVHELGYGEDTTLTAPPDNSGGKNSIQAVRSTWSYLRRLTAESLLGIATSDNDDDDGAGAEPEEPQEKPDMPQGMFEKNAAQYHERILQGKGTPAQLIAKLQTKYNLSVQQIESINNMVDDSGENHDAS